MTKLTIDLKVVGNRIKSLTEEIEEYKTTLKNLIYLRDNFDTFCILLDDLDEKPSIISPPAEERPIPELAPQSTHEVFTCDFEDCEFESQSSGGLHRHRTQVHKPIERPIPPKMEIPTEVIAPTIPKDPVIDFNAYKPVPTPAPPALGVNPAFEKQKDTFKIIVCPNPNCHRRVSFVKGTGVRANGLEWCHKKCFDEYVPLAPKEI